MSAATTSMSHALQAPALKWSSHGDLVLAHVSRPVYLILLRFNTRIERRDAPEKRIGMRTFVGLAMVVASTKARMSKIKKYTA